MGTVYSFIEVCRMEEGIIFANVSLRGYVFTIINGDMIILKPHGWEMNVNPVSQVGMRRFVKLKETVWRSELEKFAKTCKKTSHTYNSRQ